MLQWFKRLFELGEKFSPEAIVLRDLHNKERAKERSKPKALVLNAALCRAAQAHAEWMAVHKKLSHDEFGSPFTSRLYKEGYHFWSAGENIAMGQPTPEAVMKAWMASRGHRQNILKASYRDVGFGVARANGMAYWCADFGSQQNGFGMAVLQPDVFLSGPLGPDEETPDSIL